MAMIYLNIYMIGVIVSIVLKCLFLFKSEIYYVNVRTIFLLSLMSWVDVVGVSLHLIGMFFDKNK